MSPLNIGGVFSLCRLSGRSGGQTQETPGAAAGGPFSRALRTFMAVSCIFKTPHDHLVVVVGGSRL